MLIVTLPWFKRFMVIRNNTYILLDLLPLEALDFDVSFLPSMFTNNLDIDNARKQVLKCTQDLIEALNKQKSQENEINNYMNSLILLTEQSFEIEEKEMKK